MIENVGCTKRRRDKTVIHQGIGQGQCVDGKIFAVSGRFLLCQKIKKFSKVS